jgi:hypothetical protein
LQLVKASKTKINKKISRSKNTLNLLSGDKKY